jgi:hypothetical protein
VDAEISLLVRAKHAPYGMLRYDRGGDVAGSFVSVLPIVRRDNGDIRELLSQFFPP